MSTVIETEKEQDVECPNCKNHFDLTVKQKSTKPKVVIEEKETTIIKENHTHDHSHEEKPEPTKFTHQDMEKVMPFGVNFSTCPGGNCCTKIKNQKIATKFKKCTNCNTNTVPKKSEFCPTCGKTPEDDEWDESDVEIKRQDEEEDE